jgi:hypothetical protein
MMTEKSEWESWIERFDVPDYEGTSYDRLLEICVSSYGLNEKSRKSDLKDRVQFLCKWWFRNRKFMKLYISYQQIATLLNLENHATIHHHLYNRKPTINYDFNTKCINDFLNS